MKIEKSAQSYKGIAITCAKITADKQCTWRLNELTEGGNYAWQCVVKAEAEGSFYVTIGDKTAQIDVSTDFTRQISLFKDTVVEGYPYCEITFPIGIYYIYHSQLEHGDIATDWGVSDDDVNQYIETVRTIAVQTADKFSWLVESGTSATNFLLTSRTAELISDYINLNGTVVIGAISSDLRSVLLGNNEIHSLLNHSAVDTITQGTALAYSGNYLAGLPTYLEWGDGLKEVALGIIAWYNEWQYTQAPSYIPVLEGEFEVFHTYNYSNDSRFANKRHADWWKNGNSWCVMEYSQTPISSNLYFSNGVNALLNMHKSDLACFAKIKLSRSGSYVTLKSIEILPNCYAYDSDLNDFALQNTKSTLGSKLGKLCSDNDMTIIDGGKLATGSVTADKILVNALEAICAKIGGFSIVGNNIECETDTDSNNPSIFLRRYNANKPYTYGESSYTYPSQRHLQNGYIETAVSPNHDYCMPYRHEIFRNADGETWFCAYGDSVKALDSITWEDYESGLIGANSTTHRYIDPNGDFRFETNASLHIRILTGGEITLAQDGYSYPGQAQRATPFRLLDIYCEEVNINNKEVWTAGNLVCGHGESASISSHTGGNATITIPTDEIGSNPVINFTKYNYSDDVWLNSISTSGTNTVINVGVYNGGSSARTVKFDYMIAKHS